MKIIKCINAIKRSTAVIFTSLFLMNVLYYVRMSVLLCVHQSRLYSGAHGTIDIWDATAGKYTLLGKITHSYGSVHALAVTTKYIIAGDG